MSTRGFLETQGAHVSTETQGRVEGRLRAWEEARFAERLWAKDPTLWVKDPATPEVTDRLGWLTLAESAHGAVRDLASFAQEARADGMRHAVLLGMGGSSLAPEVFQQTFGNAEGYPALTVLDTTHPDAVREARERLDLSKSLFIVSSKSGTTTETSSLFHYFWQAVTATNAAPGTSFAAVTDPGTPLERLARERGFRRVFQAQPDVGGRYSALSVFGLAPAALIGVDLVRLLGQAAAAARACDPGAPARDNPGLALGALLGELALAGRDKVTFFTSPRLDGFPAWVEQLIAESTGKDGKGIVPIVQEPPWAVGQYGQDRIFVFLLLEGQTDPDVRPRMEALARAGHPVIEHTLSDVYELGAEMFRWEVAVAAASAVLGIHPFDQPDVQLAKDLAREAMGGGGDGPSGGAPQAVDVRKEAALSAALRDWLASARPGDYAAVQAYLPPSPETTRMLQNMRAGLGRRLMAATTLGYGPRFLHSTGQLHKGGPNTGLFLQIVDEPVEVVPVPERDYSFGMLIRAQASGDAAALQQRGRRMARVNLGRDRDEGLRRLAQAFSGL
jgi:transaldolase/glucose-6-phosphate isomerase